MLSTNYLSEPMDSHKTVLICTRRLEKATKNCPGRTHPNDLFVTSDHRFYMNEIAKTDPKLLDTTVRQFLIENKPTEKCISILREIFTDNLTSVCINLPGNSDEDEEWEISLSQNSLSQPLTSKAQNSLISCPDMKNPWVTKHHVSTKMPEEYEKYVEGISFLGRYEIVRILRPFGPIEPTSKLWNQIKTKRGVEINEVLHEECKQYYRDQPKFFTEMSKIISRNLPHIWTLSLKEFPPAGPRTHVIFSGDIVLEDHQLVLTLHPPKTGNSRRYYRLFSSERFLHIKINMDMNGLDGKQKSSLKRLLLHPLPLAGRLYKFLYAKSDILYYFAISGLDLPNNISIREAINYNLPLELNKEQTTAKFYSRISLGFSNSTPTIVFKPDEIRCVEDITIGENCFTDGCSAISLAAMKEIAGILGCKETPSALQGRIGGAKGIWYISPSKDINDDRWIELRESQIKYKVNYSNDDNDVHLRTLEIVSVVMPPRTPGALNSQFIRVLHNGGVRDEVFLKMVKDYIDKIKSEVVNCDDPYSLIAWVMNVSNIMKKRLEIFNRFEDDYSDDGSGSGDASIVDGNAISGFPNSPSEQCIQMLQAGFTPSTCPFLAKKLKSVLSLTLRSLSKKFRINVPLSRILICIADPTKTLKPGEVFIQLDKEAGCDERTGLPFGVIEGELIVARNPCNLPSDIMKVRAVKNTHLSIYYNIVIFPVKAVEGEVSLIDHLSGGDYDGDKVFCCWDPAIVKHFKNSPLSLPDPNVEQAFIKHKQTVDELLKSSKTSDEIEFKIQEVILDNYFKDKEPTLGLYDRWHRLQSSKYGISDKSSIYLAQMCAKLVDSTKQGLTIKPNVQQKDNELFGKLPIPYWMNNDNSKTHSKTLVNKEVRDVMDLLCITIEKEIKEVNSKEFSVARITQDPVDPHIREFWENELKRARQMEEEGVAYKDDLNLIFSSTSEIIKMYNKKYFDILDRKEIEQSSTKSNLTTNSSRSSDELRGVDNEFLTKFLDNPPVENYKGSVFKFLKDRRSLTQENIDPLAMFELQLKAASLYLSSVEKKPDGQVCWVIAFRILCNIKSQMIDKYVFGGPRSIIEEVWQSLKIDKKWLNEFRSNK